MKDQTTILISGSRKLKETPENLRRLELALDEIHAILATENDNWNYPGRILHGGAKGADQVAGQLARKLGLTEDIHLPDYDIWNRKYAPLRRNLEMIDEADAVIVIYAPHCVRVGGSGFVASRTAKAGKHLLEVMPDGTRRHTPPPAQLQYR
ncbi:MAG TPA: hypothetical protein ENJ95_03530 [Bacteroidetes bacterium]|nr:hypothetical protein [Bacteroidota bacterium]